MKMPKTSSSKTPLKVEEKPVIEEKKSTSKPKKLGKEIDDIFAGKKRKNPEAAKKQNEDGTEKPKSKGKVSEKKMKTKKLRSEGDYELKSRDEPPRPKRKTEDGFTIYTEEELGISKANAGSTNLCPFDCDCCF